MKRNVIYFPYIRVPQNEWFTRVLLYWDQVGSIVPIDFDNDPSKLGEYMYGLIQEDLVKPIIPGLHVDEIPNFTEAFIEYVDSPNYPVPRGAINREGVSTFRVHMEKLGPIGYNLVERGLARKKHDWSWYDIETYTANQFMAYLAATLGKLPEIESKPITNSIQNIDSFTPQYHQRGELRPEIDEMRTVILRDIIPAPSGGINPEDLADFKDDHKRELTRFRNKVESSLLAAAAIENPSLRSDTIKQFINETRDEVDDLSKRMKDRGWKRITNGVLGCSILAFGMGSAATGGLMGVVGAAFGASKVVYDFIQDGKSADALASEYTAYVVLAQQEL